MSRIDTYNLSASLQDLATSDAGFVLTSKKRKVPYILVRGSPSNSNKVANALERVWTRLQEKRDRNWVFAWVYWLVTNGEIAFASKARHADVVHDWIVNFYQFYMLNLNAWFAAHDAEGHWVEVFKADDISKGSSGPLQNALALEAALQAHVWFDLPRMLCNVHVRLTSPSRPDLKLGDLKADYDSSSEVFAFVVAEILASGQLTPFQLSYGAAWMLSGVVNKFYAKLPYKREVAWQYAFEKYYKNVDWLQVVRGVPIADSPTDPLL